MLISLKTCVLFVGIIPEIAEHAHYIMQILKIGSSQVLTFFDRGANVNLIDGELAISENLKRMSEKSSTLKVVGGGLVQTDYGISHLIWDPLSLMNFMNYNA